MQGALKVWYWVSERMGQASTFFGPFWGNKKANRITAGVLGACGALYDGIRAAKFGIPKWSSEQDSPAQDEDEELGSSAEDSSQKKLTEKGSKGNSPCWAYTLGIGYHLLLLITMSISTYFSVSSAVGRAAEAHGHDKEVFPTLNKAEWVIVVIWSLIQYLFELSNGGVEVLKGIVEKHHLKPDIALHTLCLPLRMFTNKKAATGLASVGSVAHSVDHILTMTMFVPWHADPSKFEKVGYALFGLVLAYAGTGTFLETAAFEGTISYRNLKALGQDSRNLRERLKDVELPKVFTKTQANAMHRIIQSTGGPVHGLDCAVPILQALRAVGVPKEMAYAAATVFGLGSGIGNHQIEVVNAGEELAEMTKTS